MSEKQKQVEKERKAVLQLLLEITGLKYKELVDAQVGMWVHGEGHRGDTHRDWCRHRGQYAVRAGTEAIATDENNKNITNYFSRKIMSHCNTD